MGDQDVIPQHYEWHGPCYVSLYDENWGGKGIVNRRRWMLVRHRIDNPAERQKNQPALGLVTVHENEYNNIMTCMTNASVGPYKSLAEIAVALKNEMKSKDPRAMIFPVVKEIR